MTGYEYRGRPAPAERPQPEVRVAVVRLADVQAHPHNVRTDLGDLRTLTDSIREYGVQVPLIVERRGHTLRLRDGHRRLAAAKLAGVTRAPAVIHPDALDDEEWLRSSVHLNERRAQLHQADRVRTARALAELGVTQAGIAETFGVSVKKVGSWLAGDPQPNRRTRSSTAAHGLARTDLIARHREEYEQLVAEHRARLEQDT